MEAKGKGGAALYNTVGTWTEEEKEEWNRTCFDFIKDKEVSE